MKKALIAGIFFFALSLIGLRDSTRFFQSYLFAFLFWSELAFGALGLLMVFHLTGGVWAASARPILESSVRTLWIVALLFIPLLFGIHHLYLWADPAARVASQALSHKAIYLNPLSFILRAIVYFASWLLLAESLIRVKDPDRLKRLSAGGLVWFGFTISFAAIDWQMSLEPDWYSTIYGMVFATGQALGAWAFVLLVYSYSRIPSDRKTQLDQGNILLTLIMLWAYLSFMQYLIIWSGNLPEEVTWVLHRIRNGWKWPAYVLILFQFAAPFFLLLFRPVKTHRKAVLILCGVLLLVRIVDRYWFVMPAFRPERIGIAWTDFTLIFGLGGIWLAAFLFRFERRRVENV